ncbi:signal transducer and transcription activator-like, partial [Contarinia nasturtii]|uniref:signal transducer and transcription activator-like n=1 Tax=Contarinia nasturtii TaxID=265458 RepID=UPI0012D39129
MAPWNTWYNEVPFIRVKSLYKDDIVFGLRQLLFEWISGNIPDDSRENRHNFMRCLVQQLILSHQEMDIKVLKYWIGSIDMGQIMSSYDHFAKQFIDGFIGERNIYNDENKQCQEIDYKIQYLRMLNMCNKISMQRLEFQWKSYLPGCNNQADIVDSIKSVIQLMTYVLQMVIESRNNFLSPFRECQNLPESCLSRLAEIQVWFDELAEIIRDTRTLINGIQKYDERCCYAELHELNELFKQLINSIMVLENQPSEIMTKEKNCTTTVRVLLTLGRFTSVRKLNLDVTMFSETEMETSPTTENGATIGTSQFQVEDKSLICHLKNMKASVKSWPFFVIVHQNQKSVAKAAIWWDKHFPNVDRSNSKSSVPWESMEVLLKTIFKHETGCDLSDLNLKALYEKCSNGIIKNGQFVWSQSCAKMPKFTFTYWDWFFCATILTKKCLSEAWKDGLIDGFSSDRLSAQQLRKRLVVGTFLLRFSDSELGALTPVFLAYDGNSKLVKKKFTPITIKEFEIMIREPNDPMYCGIGNLISKLKECTHLANGVSKSEAFKNHITTLPNKTKVGYETRPVSTSGSAQIQTPRAPPQ